MNRENVPLDYFYSRKLAFHNEMDDRFYLIELCQKQALIIKSLQTIADAFVLGKEETFYAFYEYRGKHMYR